MNNKHDPMTSTECDMANVMYLQTCISTEYCTGMKIFQKHNHYCYCHTTMPFVDFYIFIAMVLLLRYIS
jgi:hypothetical protein